MPKSISRRYIFMPATVISAHQHNAEHDLFVDAINDLYAKIDPLEARKVSLAPFSQYDLQTFIEKGHNPDGSAKAIASYYNLDLSGKLLMFFFGGD
ncbi:MAG: hypothetical protein QXT86_12465 [Archaeoglobaceae archaeon]